MFKEYIHNCESDNYDELECYAIKGYKEGKLFVGVHEYEVMVNVCPLCGYQPERSKREDLFCENLALIESAVEYTHSDYCSLNCCDTCVSLSKIISEHKMRCSEHCGNTVRDK